MVSVTLLWSRLAYATFDPELAALSGVPVRRLEHVLLALTAVVVVVGVRTVGVMLVSACIVVPAATARVVGGSLARMAVAGRRRGCLRDVRRVSWLRTT